MSLAMLAFFAFAAVLPPNESLHAARTVLQDFAHCTVKSNRALASQALIEDWSTVMMIERQLITSDCLKVSPSFVPSVVNTTFMPSGMEMKAALGEWSARLEKNEVPSEQISSAPPLALRAPDFRSVWNGSPPPSTPPKTDLAKDKEAYEENVLVAKIGECLVRANPAAAHTLLRTQVDSADEQSAAQSVAQSLSKCVPAGTDPVLSVEGVRTAVGLAYYRLEMAARGSVWNPAVTAK